ncbi:hypothetical protein [Cytobacillus praedii]|uniref:hypothetical protein n=1 Tax=Cytobacillus praedii TaxID=1742358 RepID=UPI002E1B0595|nr:hypothetical protein [Cytobacillus praedii]
MKGKFIGFLVAVMVFGFTTPTNMSYAQESKEIVTEEEVINQTFNVSQEEVDEAQKIVNIILELDENLNMYDLSINKSSDLESLSKEAQDFYKLYKEKSEQTNGNVTQDDVLSVINNYYQSTITETKIQRTSLNALPKIKEYTLTHQQVTDIVKLVGVHGTGWAFAAAIAKKFAKSPTLITMLIVAVPALGAAVLNACNRYNNGVIIQRISIGTFHNWNCKAIE